MESYNIYYLVPGLIHSIFYCKIDTYVCMFVCMYVYINTIYSQFIYFLMYLYNTILTILHKLSAEFGCTNSHSQE